MDRLLEILILLASVAGILVYGWLALFSPWTMLVIQLTAFIATAAVLGVIVWIGYTLAMTPLLKPIEELTGELEARSPRRKRGKWFAKMANQGPKLQAVVNEHERGSLKIPLAFRELILH